MPRPVAAWFSHGIYDYEYQRQGVSNLFMLFAPLEGWRRVAGDGPAHQGPTGPEVVQASWWTRTIPIGSG